MKIVHLSNDEKFLPLAQSLFEEAFPGGNRYLLPTARRGARRYVMPSPQVAYRPSLCFRAPWIRFELTDADAVVVHQLSSRFAPALRHVRPDCLVVWLSGGGDYMQLLEPRLGGLLLPQTAELLRASTAPPRVTGLRQLGAGLRRWMRWVSPHPAPRLAKPPPLLSVAHRIDVFSANPADAVLLREMVPALRAAHHVVPSFTVEDVFDAGASGMDGPDVLLGNSATPSNNHLEAMHLLRDRLPPGGRVIAPLSYGKAPQGYASAVARAGSAIFGCRFEALSGWMPIEAYNARIARCGTVLMNHRRQQAVGNTSAALYRGATVYMRRDNPLFGFFGSLGVNLLAIDDLEADPTAPIRSLTAAQRLVNRRAIERRFGRTQIVAAIRALEGYRRGREAAA
jgi:hypothetical protein